MPADKYAYRVIWSDEDGEYVGLCAEFPSLSWLAKTQEAAFKGICKVVFQTVKEMKQRHETLPQPIATRSYSGKFLVRVPPDVHRRLAIEAEEAHISLNRLVSAKLAVG